MVEYITYPNKSRGDIWSSGNVNEIKEVVNANAEELQTHANRLTAAESAISDMGQVVTHDTNSASILPNRLHVWSSPVSSLTLDLDVRPGEYGRMNEYMLQFIVSGSAFTLTLPSGIRWVEEPEWENGWTYQVSIVDGLAVTAGWRAATL